MEDLNNIRLSNQSIGYFEFLNQIGTKTNSLATCYSLS